MSPLKWSTSHAVFVPEIDDEHKEIFEAIYNLQRDLANGDSLPEVRQLIERLTSSVVEHFAHEERLMRAARYTSIGWHKQQHMTARKRVGQFVQRIEEGDGAAGIELAEYLTTWLHDHTRLADQMMAAFLRNHRRSMWKVTFRAGTKPADACDWVDANGNRFDPEPCKQPK